MGVEDDAAFSLRLHIGTHTKQTQYFNLIKTIQFIACDHFSKLSLNVAIESLKIGDIRSKCYLV